MELTIRKAFNIKTTFFSARFKSICYLNIYDTKQNKTTKELATGNWLIGNSCLDSNIRSSKQKEYINMITQNVAKTSTH
jgi:hypothetical protein